MTDQEQSAAGVADTAPTHTRGAKFFEALLANSGDVLTLLDDKGHYIYHSPAINEMMGIEPEDALGFFAADIVHEDDRDRVADRIRYCLANRGVRLSESFRLPHTDGSWRWVEADVRNLLDDPDIQGVLVVSRDVTSRRRLEDHFSIAEHTAGFGTYRWDRDRNARVISSALSRMLDLPAGTRELPDAILLDLLHPDDAERVKETMKSLEDGPKPFSHSMRLRRRDGSYRHFVSHGFPELDDKNEVRSVIGILDDVTETLNTELSLKRTAEEYQLIADHAHDMFARHAPDGSVNFISPAIKKVLGYTPEDAIGQKMVEWVHRDDKAMVEQKMEELRNGAESVLMTFRLWNAAGKFVWLESTVHRIDDEETGEIIEAIAITRDVSERKEYEQRLLDAREKAETANRTKSTFLANMSHELRTPLNAVIGFSEILKRKMYGPLGDEVYDEYANLIHESGTHLLDLINDILDMSKVEAGKMEIRPEPIDMVEIIETCMRFVEAKAEAKNQHMHLNMMEPDLNNTAFADIRATKQILINLLSNAVKFTGEGGSIRVDVQMIAGDLEISVCDNGVGIDREDIPRLLRPFEQIADKSSQAEEGSGLGLALTKSLAELQGGAFRLESEKGEGTQAIVTLPSAHPHVQMNSGGA